MSDLFGNHIVGFLIARLILETKEDESNHGIILQVICVAVQDIDLSLMLFPLLPRYVTNALYA